MNVLAYAPPKIKTLLSARTLISRQGSRANQKLWVLVSLGFLIILASFFLWQNSQIIAKTYQLQHLKEKLVNLEKENQFLEASAAKENSLSNLEELVKALGLEKAQNISFIQAMEKTVVAR